MSTRSEQMKAASEERKRWLTSLALGEVSFRQTVEASQSQRYRMLSRIKLADILSARSGWSKETAHEALLHHKFNISDNILNIRRNDKKINLFSMILDSSPGFWKERPRMPTGWPFRAPLKLLLESTETQLPESFEHLFDEGSDDSIDTISRSGDEKTSVERTVPVSDDDDIDIEDMFR